MDDDQEIPKIKQPQTFPRNLEPLSVAMMEAYIVELEAEIGRVRETIAKRGDAKSKAEALFR